MCDAMKEDCSGLEKRVVRASARLVFDFAHLNVKFRLERRFWVEAAPCWNPVAAATELEILLR